jgi:hypothetical protein
MLSENLGMLRRWRIPLSTAGVVIALFLWGATRATAATFTVMNANDSGPGSLRQAITDANNAGGLNTINFSIPAGSLHAINLLSNLPPIFAPTVIDGTTQNGYSGKPIIEINGAGAGSDPGLALYAGGGTVQGLTLNRFAAEAIHVEGGGGNIIRANFIGTDTNGTAARANGMGIYVYGSSGNLIGGTNASDRNLISGNTGTGVYVYQASDNIVQGNLIGTTLAGTARLPNGNNGMILYNGSGNLVGGANAGARNVFSGNTGSGVYLYTTDTTANFIQGNYVGTDISGSLALSNSADGITIAAAAANFIGGTNAGAGNVISGNGTAGVGINGPGADRNLIQGNLIGCNAAGTAALGNGYGGLSLTAAANNLLGGFAAEARNIISGNRQDGVLLSTNSLGNLIVGNYIGLNAAGTAAVGNLFNGISANGSGSNCIGGITASARNIITGNANHGVQFFPGTAPSLIQGCFIGTDPTGHSSIGTQSTGIRIQSAAHTIGGSATGAGNVISGNNQDGVFIIGAGASTNLIQANYIGTTADGLGALANAPYGNFPNGIEVSNAPGTQIIGNIVSASQSYGIVLVNAGAAGTQILGNKVGTDVTGMVGLGNYHDGIWCNGSKAAIIGGPGSGNVISGNGLMYGGSGIWLNNSSSNVIQANLIGIKIDGISALGNLYSDVSCSAGSTNNLIGGGVGAGNVIAYSVLSPGVSVHAGALNNRIVGNSIFSNSGLGIDLDPTGINANDPCDADTGANQLQNCPVLTQSVTGSGVGVRGTLNSVANSTFLLQFFASSTADGSGEGRIYLGDKTVSTGADCNTSFVAALPGSVPAGYVITATATDGAGNTSEFSAASTVAAAPGLTATRSSSQITLTWSNTPSGFALKSAASLQPPIQWTTVTNTPTLVNGQYILNLPFGAANSFFALVFH